MTTGSTETEKGHLTFLVGGFGVGKSNFFDAKKDCLFSTATLAGFDTIADQVVEAINTPAEERDETQKHLLYNITHVKDFAENQGIVNKATNDLRGNSFERLAKLEAQKNKTKKDITRTEVRDMLGKEIALYDGTEIAAKIRDGEHIVLDSTGRADIRADMYKLFEDNQLLGNCTFSAYNLVAPSDEHAAEVATRRLWRDGNLYTADKIEETLSKLFPPPIYSSDDIPLDYESIVQACA